MKKKNLKFMNDKIKFKKKSKEKKLRFPSKGEIKNYLVLPISVFYLKYLDSRHTKVAILIKQKKKKNQAVILPLKWT